LNSGKPRGARKSPTIRALVHAFSPHAEHPVDELFFTKKSPVLTGNLRNNR
jgi:hypothetical protein